MLEQLAADHDVKALVVERERLLDVGPARLDSERGRLLQRVPVDVHAHDVVSGRVGTRQGAVAAPEVEHSPPRPADVPPEQRGAFRPGEDEVLGARGAVMLAVPVACLLQPAHGSQSRRRPGSGDRQG
jgi:hypothetical protein